jgi:hypothetical protein
MVVLRDGGSVPIPPHTNLRVTGPTGATADVVLPTPTSCAIFLCVREGFEQYDIAIPGPRSGSRICGSGFGACDPPTTEEVLGNLRIVVETYAGPGGPPSTNLLESPWDIAPQTSFAGTEAAALPATPQIDFNSLVFQSYGGTAGIHGGRPGLQASVGFDRPVMVTVTPRGTECGEALAPQSTAAPTTRIDMRFENRCWGAT